jgi:hypothetical protein
MNQILASMKQEAIDKLIATGASATGCTKEINGNKIKARVWQQRSCMRRWNDAIVCTWYVNDQKSSLAKVEELIK